MYFPRIKLSDKLLPSKSLLYVRYRFFEEKLTDVFEFEYYRLQS